MSDLSALGLVLPTPAYLAGLLVFGIVGWVAYRRGKTSGNTRLKWVGVAMMLYPYAVPQAWLLWAIGVLGTAWCWFHWE